MATADLTSSESDLVAPSSGLSAWSYEEAFKRNRGLITEAEQEKLRNSRIAIAGMGGVGGVHLMTLARLGIGSFRIADPDTFELTNFNRQYGADIDTVGLGKASVMAGRALAVNSGLDLQIFPEAITEENVGNFLAGVDVFVDGIDFFSIGARRLIFREAHERGIWSVTGGPIGFSTAWLVFDPAGMSFDRYFDLHDKMDRIDQLVAFAVGLTPRATHLPYMDLSQVDQQQERGPSLGLACQLASGVVAAEVAKIVLGRGRIRSAPCYMQFDPYRYLFRKGRLARGNRHLVQRIKRYVLKKRFAEMEGEI